MTRRLAGGNGLPIATPGEGNSRGKGKVSSKGGNSGKSGASKTRGKARIGLKGRARSPQLTGAEMRNKFDAFTSRAKARGPRFEHNPVCRFFGKVSARTVPTAKLLVFRVPFLPQPSKPRTFYAKR